MTDKLSVATLPVMQKRSYKEKGRYLSCPAGEQIRAWCSKKELSQRTFGILVGVSRQVVHDWMNGHSRPEYIQRIILEYLTGVERDMWLTSGERDTIRKACIEVDRLRRARQVPELSVREKVAGKI